MALLFGWNAYPDGLTVDWSLASQATAFVYLGADRAYEAASQDAAAAGLLVGPYWSLTSSLDPEGQVEVFLSRTGNPKRGLPPAVFMGRAEQLPALKLFVEALEQRTGRRALIGGTPDSLKSAGQLFGRTNPLWISHKPLFGGPSIPVGWSNFAVWQSETSAQVKGVRGTVGLNVADASFLGKQTKALALGLGALLLAAVAYHFIEETKP